LRQRAATGTGVCEKLHLTGGSPWWTEKGSDSVHQPPSDHPAAAATSRKSAGELSKLSTFTLRGSPGRPSAANDHMHGGHLMPGRAQAPMRPGPSAGLWVCSADVFRERTAHSGQRAGLSHWTFTLLSTYMASAEAGSPRRQFAWPICAMAQERPSRKPMTAILTRLSRKFGHIRILVFEERDILEQPVEACPVVDALISFYSHGFPLEKVLRTTFREREIQSFATPSVIEATPRREDDLIGALYIGKAEDHIVLNGVTFNKAFHGWRRLRPAVPQRWATAAASTISRRAAVRRLGSFVYAIGGDYAHARSSESPALDGKVERDPEGKEDAAGPVDSHRSRKNHRQKIVVEASNQTVCGFDLLGANGVSYVCDVNGFSFVKSSEKYYDDCAFILATCSPRPLRRLCPCQSVSQHGTGLRWFEPTFRHRTASMLARSILMQAGHDGDGFKESPKEDRSSIEQVLECNGRFGGHPIAKRTKIRSAKAVKAPLLRPGAEVGCRRRRPAASCSSGAAALTEEGRAQAEKLGRARSALQPLFMTSQRSQPSASLARGIYHWRRELPPPATDWALSPAFDYRHDLKIYVSNEAASKHGGPDLAKAFPRTRRPFNLQSLVQMASNSLAIPAAVGLGQNTCPEVHVGESMSLDRRLTEGMSSRSPPDGSAALIRAMCNLGNSKAACRGMRDGIEALIAQLEQMELQPATQACITARLLSWRWIGNKR
uniref:Inositol hexakisphosphate and diphosphoinositol-pentakisphosphate kinase n=1 Tax=Macrostomum lignano TaxID=282301 RepID=A0A1I8FDT8_9PLAT